MGADLFGIPVLATTPVFIVEDDPAYVSAVRQALTTDCALILAGQFQSAEHCEVTACTEGSVWLIDLGLPGTMSGLELIQPIVSMGGLVLVTSVFEDETRVLAAIQAGAKGYFVKGDGNLLETIHMLIRGYSPLSPKVAAHLLRRIRSTSMQSPTLNLQNPLSPRELETLQALAHGATYKEIATAHRVSYHTVGDHVKSIYKKLHVNSKTSAINQALKQGLLSLDDV